MNVKQSLNNLRKKGKYISGKEDSNNHGPISRSLTLEKIIKQITGQSTYKQLEHQDPNSGVQVKQDVN